MAKKNQATTISKSNLEYNHEFVTPEGFVIAQGDLIKIKGEYGVKFKFYSLTTNINTDAQWIDCFEVFRGQVGAFRSFRTERLKRIPTRGKRAKRVS
jgi:hypothetical protein